MASKIKLPSVTGLVVLVLAGAGLYAWKPWAKSSESDAPKLETTAIERGQVVSKVTASGTLSALVTVQVGSQVSGRIKELHADFNSTVRKGDVIAKIDPQLFSAALAQARANTAAAEGDLKKSEVVAAQAQRALARVKTLADKKLVAEAEMDVAQADFESASASVIASRGRVAQARAALHQAQVNLEYTTIKSPIDGIVISRSVDVGQTVAASLQAPTLFVIAESLKNMQVDTSVAEADIGKLRDGMSATFTVDAYPQERFTGRVRQIRNAATNVQNVITYDAVIDVENPELKLKPGMTANVSFVYADKDEVLVVPNAALRFRPTPEMLGVKEPGGSGGSGGAEAQLPAIGMKKRAERDALGSAKRTIWILRGGKPVSVEIKVGITDGSRTEIVEGGVREGEQVITDSDSGGAKTPGAGAQMPMRRIL